MTNPTRHLAPFLGDLCRFVEGTGDGDAPAMAERRRFADLLRSLDPRQADTFEAGIPFGLPACRYWAAAIAGEGNADPLADLRHALAGLGPWLVWTQNPNYRRAPPSADFLDRYGYAVIAGPRDGPAALVEHATLALGVLLLGPGAHYPLHHHPATEIYVPLNTAEWWRGEGPWREEAPGAVILHPSGVPHATRTSGEPLLAVYLWSGDLETHARLTAMDSGRPDKAQE
jgi:quercetin dioxygenase-like cupin family protein